VLPCSATHPVATTFYSLVLPPLSRIGRTKTALLDTPAQALHAQLDELDNSLSEWGFSLHQRMIATYNRYTLNGHAVGGENFVQTAAVALCRHVSLWRFDQCRQEAAEHLHAFNTSAAVQEAMRVLDMATPPLHFDLDVVPSRDTSLSNEAWDDQAYTAFFHLMDCGRAWQEQLSELRDALGKRLR